MTNESYMTKEYRRRIFWENNYWLLVCKNRIINIKKSVGIPALIAFASIIIIEFWLRRIPATNYFCESIGNIYLKLCYSYCSAFIFYFIVVYLPKEKKKISLWVLLNNKTGYISRELALIIRQINQSTSCKLKEDVKNITRQEFELALKPINALQPFIVKAMGYETHYKNWYEYLYSKRETIRKYIAEIAVHSENVDSEFLSYLTNIDNGFQLNIHANAMGGSDISYMGFFFEVFVVNEQLMSLRFNNIYRQYNLEQKIRFQRARKRYEV